MAKNNEENPESTSNAEAAADVATESPYQEAPKARKRIDLTGYNTLSIVSIATALTGFGVIVGYVGIGLAILGGLGKIVLGIWGIKNGYGPTPFGDFDHMDRQFGGFSDGGQMGGFGGHMEGGRGFGDDDMGGMMVDPNQPAPLPSAETGTTQG